MDVSDIPPAPGEMTPISASLDAIAVEQAAHAAEVAFLEANFYQSMEEIFSPVAPEAGCSRPSLSLEAVPSTSSVVDTSPLVEADPVPGPRRSFASVASASRPNIPFFPVSIDRANTLLVKVPTSLSTSITRHSFMSSLFKIVSPNAVCSVQLCPGHNYRVTFKEGFSAERTKLLLRGISHDGLFFQVYEAEQRAVRITVTRLPVEVPDTVIKGAFSTFGNVLAFHRETYPAHPHVFTGVINLLMHLSSDIPAVVQFGPFQAGVSYRRQPRQCRICTRRNHRTDKCPYKGCCATCGKKGHSSVACLTVPSTVDQPTEGSVSRVDIPCPPSPTVPPPVPPSESFIDVQPPSAPSPLPRSVKPSVPSKIPTRSAKIDSSLSFSLARSATRPAPPSAPKKIVPQPAVSSASDEDMDADGFTPVTYRKRQRSRSNSPTRRSSPSREGRPKVKTKTKNKPKTKD